MNCYILKYVQVEDMARIVANFVLMDTMDYVQRNAHQSVTKPAIKYMELVPTHKKVIHNFCLITLFV